ncbi:hypothetical protein IDM40_17745 [Nocardiopsis sp. HNM0947]|uniref:DUF6194 domain-containing protein n=2 Tax=Nocardiopsis coralli TaxID=2772213 RepID=A0ABR9P9M3_9ACTN|nr:hypothetical protein [Nocardiopsis coralli]
MQQFLDTVRSFDSVLELAPTEGSGFPEIAWGDHFFYYAPDGKVPNGQPYATFVTKDYPGDTGSGLDAPGRWRINVHVGKKAFAELVTDPEQGGGHDFGAADVLLPHPLYADQGWIAVVDPGPGTTPMLLELVRRAHDAARERARRRTG